MKTATGETAASKFLFSVFYDVRQALRRGEMYYIATL